MKVVLTDEAIADLIAIGLYIRKYNVSLVFPIE